MITEEEYKQWKPLIEEYEEYLFQQGTLEALYCTECQAMDAHDCSCNDDDGYCEYCREFDEHRWDCIHAGEDNNEEDKC